MFHLLLLYQSFFSATQEMLKVIKIFIKRIWNRDSDLFVRFFNAMDYLDVIIFFHSQYYFLG